MGAAKSPLSSVSHQRNIYGPVFRHHYRGRRPGRAHRRRLARRAGKSVLLLERESFGGQIASSPKVENFPGLPAVSGAELAERLYSQAEALGTRIELERRWRSRAARPAGWSPTTVPIPPGR
ncbi:MAG: hypothetical protein ACLTYN_14020 [Dysosmobacter welbionis]